MGSNDLDEYRIDALQQQGATIDMYGVGTRLSTCYDQPALGGAYKLAALADEHGVLTPRIKLTEQTIKVSLPGCLVAKRMYDGEVPVGDVLLDLDHSAGAQDESAPLALCSLATGEPVATPEHTRIESLSVPVMRAGQRVAAPPALADVRARAKLEPAIGRCSSAC
ncbi:MAG: hypothetical protein KC593_14685 [Myxococcales bacterium]|nr:hypothetical protein [Myxococcales bacterium]